MPESSTLYYEYDDTTLSDKYATKKEMNESEQLKAYAQYENIDTFNLNYAQTPSQSERKAYATLGGITQYGVTLKNPEKYNIKSNYVMTMLLSNQNEMLYKGGLSSFQYPSNVSTEYAENQPPDKMLISEYHHVTNFKFNCFVHVPTFEFIKNDNGTIIENYTDENITNDFNGLKYIVENNITNIYVKNIEIRQYGYHKENYWTSGYGIKLIPFIYVEYPTKCYVNALTALLKSPFSIVIQTNRQYYTSVNVREPYVNSVYKTDFLNTTEYTNQQYIYPSQINTDIEFYPDTTIQYDSNYQEILWENNNEIVLAKFNAQTTQYLSFVLYSYYSAQHVWRYLASFGLYFANSRDDIVDILPDDLHKNGNIYVGEMKDNGLTTGNFLYGENLAKSKNPNITGSSDEIEYVPIFDDNEDKIDKFEYGTQTSLNINQFVSSYVLDGVDLQNLSNEFKNPTNEIPTGDTPFDNIISLKKYPFNVKNHTITFEPSNIILSKWDTNVSASKINAAQTLINIGSFTIDRKYNNFLDYEPYTTCEIYLPFADYVPINLNKCMGSTININMIWDIDGNIKYLILCDNLLIAEINANLASSQILTAINSGLKSLQDLQNTITIASGLTSVVGSAVAGSPVGIVSSAISTVSGVVNTVTNQNTNYSTQKGQSQSDVSQKSILDFVLHITRPVVKIPKNYASTVGYILNDTKILSELSGFTVCDNVIINNINCLNNEKTEIKNLLETGVIL